MQVRQISKPIPCDVAQAAFSTVTLSVYPNHVEGRVQTLIVRMVRTG